VLASVKERDTLDTTRTISPLLKAKDAIEIDVSLLTIQEVFDLVYGKIREKIH
jgi:cytidylate kinase